ncbi:polysaccharide transporter, PST family [Marinobacter sp. DSM 26671]|jgi:PST family polysaccharide transporter|uniref:O-antigen translocase n=1 Tax=Marinobacter sp. DSM 26671 TaxID=1761793 RepID=UPI0008EF25F5|nr:O-antigen translocase [Marinobacter sp. DSM 26671]SFD95932.1 polysaccharide transporter, PST family [Marinobacter sp. DSM 26671]
MSTSNASNSRGLIRSMLVIGSAQVVNIFLSIIRMKVLAVLLGPAGIGLFGIYNNLQQMVGNAAGLGMGSSGVRQIAGAKGDAETLNRVSRVLLAAHLVQGTLAMVAVWVFRKPLAVWLTGDASLSTEIGLVGIAILLMLLATAHTTLLQGLRRIGDLGRVTVMGAIAATLIGLLAVWWLGRAGLIWFLIVQPLANLLAALFFIRKLPREADRPSIGFKEIWATWKPMARLGAAFMAGGLATTGTLLLVRAIVTRELGLDAAGYFAAAWGITMTYVGFLLGAMGADYYPRLTEVIHDRDAANRLMNDQAQLGLAIGGPVLLLLIGWAPWLITLLYASDFGPAATLLQWQTVGNVFKLASWAMSFAIVAGAHARIYFFMELSFNLVFLALIWLLLPIVGLDMTGVAFLLGYIVYFVTVYLLVRHLRSFRWQSLSLQLFGLQVLLAIGLLAVSLIVPTVGFIFSPLVAVATGILGLRIVLEKTGPEGRLAGKGYKLYARLGWPIRIVK